MEVGKKYINSILLNPVTCIGHKSNGTPVVENSSGVVYGILERFLSEYKEYVKPRTGFGYVNVYSNTTEYRPTVFGKVCVDRRIADLIEGEGRIACVRIEYTEGQFDD